MYLYGSALWTDNPSDWDVIIFVEDLGQSIIHRGVIGDKDFVIVNCEYCQKDNQKAVNYIIRAHLFGVLLSGKDIASELVEKLSLDTPETYIACAQMAIGTSYTFSDVVEMFEKSKSAANREPVVLSEKEIRENLEKAATSVFYAAALIEKALRKFAKAYSFYSIQQIFDIWKKGKEGKITQEALGQYRKEIFTAIEYFGPLASSPAAASPLSIRKLIIPSLCLVIAGMLTVGINLVSKANETLRKDPGSVYRVVNMSRFQELIVREWPDFASEEKMFAYMIKEFWNDALFGEIGGVYWQKQGRWTFRVTGMGLDNVYTYPLLPEEHSWHIHPIGLTFISLSDIANVVEKAGHESAIIIPYSENTIDVYTLLLPQNTDNPFVRLLKESVKYARKKANYEKALQEYFLPRFEKMISGSGEKYALAGDFDAAPLILQKLGGYWHRRTVRKASSSPLGYIEWIGIAMVALGIAYLIYRKGHTSKDNLQGWNGGDNKPNKNFEERYSDFSHGSSSPITMVPPAKSASSPASGPEGLSFIRRLDNKGRVVMPTAIRAQIPAKRVMLVSLPGCKHITLFPTNKYEEILSGLQKSQDFLSLPGFSNSSIFASCSFQREISKAGKISIGKILEEERRWRD
ncbi:hypothetical protein KKG36_01225, partial [Patescibacteria group bacterium]|nr:hypothetical protein [Patescibacteria group bacterium]